MEKHIPSDIFKGILAHLPENGRFQYEVFPFHRFFYERKEEYHILKDLSFHNLSGNQFSEDIMHAYDILMMANLLWSLGPSYNPHMANPKLKEIFEKDRDTYFDRKDLSELERLSKEFFDEFGIMS